MHKSINTIRCMNSSSIRHAGLGVCTFFLMGLSVSALGCAATSHGTLASALGKNASSAALDAIVEQPGPITVETVVGADWEVPLSGLLNLEHPAAKAAKLTDRSEPIVIMFHAIRHPSRGLFMIDTGVERALFDDPGHAAVRGLVASFMHTDKMQRRTDTKAWIDRLREPVMGVWLTHLHLDHVSGLRDVPNMAPVYVGPGETDERSFQNAFVAPNVDRALTGKSTLSVWRFEPDPDGAFDGVVDIFGDGTAWALHVPGHTEGSTAFVVRTATGPVLFTGDASHTLWGWDHGVEPGSYSSDQAKSAESLARLRTFARKHPSLEVRVSHQVRPRT
jgi:N-acyl homoserine lactone hydrolase